MKPLFTLLFVIVITLLIGCTESTTPVSDEPYIEFRSIHVFKSPSPQNYEDTISVTFYVRDGNFDLGFNNQDSVPPYNNMFYFRKSDGKKTGWYDPGFDFSQTIRYADRKLPGGDTLPPYSNPYNCTRWEIISRSHHLDTIYFQLNPNRFNFFADFYYLQNSNWVFYDWLTTYCITFNRRFPTSEQISPVQTFVGYKVKRLSPTEANFTFELRGYGPRYSFAGKKVKLKLHILDRALNKSNEIETSEIQY